MIKLLIFDLDDTLYDARTYLLSGFKAVAKFVSNKSTIQFSTAYITLLESLIISGRGNNFDYLIEKLSIHKHTVINLVDVYRNHSPNIVIPNSVKNILKKLAKKYTITLLTNGWITIQQKKIAVLELKKYFDSIYFAQSDGIKFQKPHEKFFKKIVKDYNIKPHEAVMIGNDFVEDIGSAKRLGIRTFIVNGPSSLKNLEKTLSSYENNHSRKK